MKLKTIKRIIGVCVAVLVLAGLCGVGLRIYKVNEECEKPVVRVFEQGETAARGYNYAETNHEGGNGYEFIVQGGTITTPDEILEYYGKDPGYYKEKGGSAFKPTYVYMLKVLIRNVNEQNQKGVQLLSTPLIADNVQLMVNHVLLEIMYPTFGEYYGFAVRPGSETVLYLPFAASNSTYDEYCDYDFYTKRKLYYVISWYPEEIRMRVRTLRKEYFYSTVEGRGEYPISFYDVHGAPIGETQIILWGNDATPPEAPEVEGCTFIGWTDQKTGEMVTDFTNVVYYANYSATYSCEVSFLDADANIIGGTQSVLYGEEALPPDAPEREGYSFVGWSDEEGNTVTDFTVKRHTNYLAVYEPNESADGAQE